MPNKINYVIATFNGKCRRSHTQPLPKDVVHSHLSQLLRINHKLDQITIMKAKSPNYYNGYYDIDELKKHFDIPIIEIECENYGYSMGQWLKAYEIYKNQFDYYIFMEDDYCGGINHFDQILLDVYSYKFTNKIGLLCSIVEGSSNYKENCCYPIHWGGSIFISKETMNQLYSNEKWNGKPRKWLDKMNAEIDTGFNWSKLRKSYFQYFTEVKPVCYFF